MSVTSRSTTLAADPRSVPEARRFISRALRELAREAVEWDAHLIITELTTNAVLHARTAMQITVTTCGEGARLEVVDHSPAIPRMRAYGQESTTGRGLRLVAHLAAGWGVQPVPAGKLIWVELVPPAQDGPGRSDETSDDVDLDLLLSRFDEPDQEPSTLRSSHRQAMRTAA